MIAFRPKYFVALEVITFAMPFVAAYVLGQGDFAGAMVTFLWILLFLASCFQVRRDLTLGISGFLVWLATYLVTIVLPAYIR